MIQIDEDIVKIVSVLKSSIDKDVLWRLTNSVRGLDTYTDTSRQEEDLYSIWICEPDHDTDRGTIIQNILTEIRQLCDEHGASYWRLID
jgi:hypothetical protein